MNVGDMVRRTAVHGFALDKPPAQWPEWCKTGYVFEIARMSDNGQRAYDQDDNQHAVASLEYAEPSLPGLSDFVRCEPLIAQKRISGGMYANGTVVYDRVGDAHLIAVVHRDLTRDDIREIGAFFTQLSEALDRERST